MNLKELARQKGWRREKLSKLESRLGRERASGGVTFGTSVSIHFTMNVYRVGWAHNLQEMMLKERPDDKRP